MGINSHVQLPHGVIKYFRDETDPEKKVWYLDIDTGEIRRKAARKLGTEKGYFSEVAEKYLCAEIESPIAELNARIREFVANEIESVGITQDDVVTAKDYVKASMLRGKPAIDAMYESSYTARLFSAQDNHDNLLAFGMNARGKFDEYLDRYSFTLLRNTSNVHFIVPRCCIIPLSKGDASFIIAPISPNAALLFCPPKILQEKGSYGVVEKDDAVRHINELALEYEFASNRDFVASDREDELAELLPKLHRLKEREEAEP